MDWARRDRSVVTAWARRAGFSRSSSAPGPLHVRGTSPDAGAPGDQSRHLPEWLFTDRGASTLLGVGSTAAPASGSTSALPTAVLHGLAAPAVDGLLSRTMTSTVSIRREPRCSSTRALELLSSNVCLQSGRPDSTRSGPRRGAPQVSRRRPAWEGDRSTAPRPATGRYSDGLRPVHDDYRTVDPYRKTDLVDPRWTQSE